MKTSFELEALARNADMRGDEARADYLYQLANEARHDEEDMSMCLPRHERAALYGAWCAHQRERWSHENSREEYHH